MATIHVSYRRSFMSILHISKEISEHRYLTAARSTSVSMAPDVGTVSFHRCTTNH